MRGAVLWVCRPLFFPSVTSVLRLRLTLARDPRSSALYVTALQRCEGGDEELALGLYGS